jgi:hypothetical protein
MDFHAQQRECPQDEIDEDWMGEDFPSFFSCFLFATFAAFAERNGRELQVA